MNEIDQDDQFFQAFKAGMRKGLYPATVWNLSDLEVWDFYIDWLTE